MVPFDMFPSEVQELLRGPEPMLHVDPGLFTLVAGFAAFLLAYRLPVSETLVTRLSKNEIFQSLFPSGSTKKSLGRRVFCFIFSGLPFILAFSACSCFVRYAIFQHESFLLLLVPVILVFCPLMFLSEIFLLAASRNDRKCVQN